MMVDGKRGKSQTILYAAFDTIRERSGKDPMEVFEAALKNIMPVLEVKARRVGGANYQVPIEVRPDRRTTLRSSLVSELFTSSWRENNGRAFS